MAFAAMMEMSRDIKYLKTKKDKTDFPCFSGIRNKNKEFRRLRRSMEDVKIYTEDEAMNLIAKTMAGFIAGEISTAAIILVGAGTVAAVVYGVPYAAKKVKKLFHKKKGIPRA
jgi:hypothetical protein